MLKFIKSERGVSLLMESGIILPTVLMYILFLFLTSVFVIARTQTVESGLTISRNLAVEYEASKVIHSNNSDVNQLWIKQFKQRAPKPYQFLKPIKYAQSMQISNAILPILENQLRLKPIKTFGLINQLQANVNTAFSQHIEASFVNFLPELFRDDFQLRIPLTNYGRFYDELNFGKQLMHQVFSKIKHYRAIDIYEKLKRFLKQRE